MPFRQPRPRPSLTPAGLTVLASLTALASLAAPLAAQQSAATLHAPVAVLPVSSAPFQRLGDFDGDGDLDAVGSRVHQARNQTEIVVWENVGGAFTPVWSGAHQLYPIGGPAPRSFAIAVADFNADGRDDFVVAGGMGTVRYVAGPGFTFATTTRSLTGIPYGHTVGTGDFDGDNLPDVAFAYIDYLGVIQLDLHRSTGGLLNAPIVNNPLVTPHVTVLELDGQPGDEVLVSDRSSPNAWIYRVSGNQLVLQQTLTSSLTYNGNTPWLWTGGDLDGDLDDDLVVFRPELGTNGVPRYEIFRRTGPATFTVEPQAIGGPAEYLADIDDDGDLDGVCCGGGGGGTNYQWPELDFASTFEIAVNRGAGDFARAWSFPGAGSESLAGAADIDGDGDVDFVAGRCVFYGRGPWIDDPMPNAGGKDVMIVGRPWQLHDVDRDGDLDFHGRNLGDGSVKYVNQTITAPTGYRYGGHIEIDVDSDGVRDRVVGLYQLNGPFPSTFQHMVWLRNNGGGRYHVVGQVGPAGLEMGTGVTTADSFRNVDCDGDGDEDVIWTSNPAAGQGYASAIFWNQNGTFAAGPTFSATTGGRIDGVSDFNGDGRPDLLTSTILATHIYLGSSQPGTPFTQAWTSLPMPFEPAATVLTDLDDDGDVDIARPNFTGEIVVYDNTTAGQSPQFAISTLTGLAIEIHHTQQASAVRATLTTGDFDADGRTDLVLGRLVDEPNVGALLRRTGWTWPLSLANFEVVHQTLVDGFACDVDGDGDLDLMGEHAVHGGRYHGIRGGRRMQHFEGVAGEAGAIPILGGTGPYRVGETDVMRLSNVPGPTLALFGLSLGQAELVDTPLPGHTLRIDPNIMLVVWWPVTTNGQGQAAALNTLPSFIMPLFAGLTFYAQTFVVDPAGPSGFSQSNVLEKRIGW
ncbi:MAG: VCBS repeat-containing protein [bacterium]|nr:VCBS repeat-containing protein [bacterium]